MKAAGCSLEEWGHCSTRAWCRSNSYSGTLQGPAENTEASQEEDHVAARLHLSMNIPMPTPRPGEVSHDSLQQAARLMKQRAFARSSWQHE